MVRQLSKTAILLVCVSCLIFSAFFSYDFLWGSGISAEPSSPLKVTGSVNIRIRPYGESLLCSFQVSQKGKPVSKVKITLDDQLIPEHKTSAGLYQLEIKDWLGKRKQTILIVIDPTGQTPPAEVAVKKIHIKGTVGQMVHISSPMTGARFRLNTTQNVLVNWEPEVRFCTCKIYEYKGNQVGDEVFSKDSITGNQLPISIKHFKDKTSYGVFLSYKMKDFVFKKKKKSVDPQSSIQFNYSVARFFSTQ